MAGDTVLVTFEARFDSVVEATKKIIKQFKLMSSELERVGKVDPAGDLAKKAKSLQGSMNQAKGAVKALTAEIKALEEAEAKFKPGSKTAHKDRLGPIASGLADPTGTRTFITKDSVTDAADEKRLQREQKITALTLMQKDAEQLRTRAWNEHGEVQAKLIAAAGKEEFIRERINRLLSSRTQTDILEERRRILAQEAEQIEKNRVAIESALTRQVGRAGDRIDRTRLREEQLLIAAQERKVALTRQLDSVEKAALKTGTTSRKDLLALDNERTRLLRKIENANRAIALAEKRKEAPEGRLGSLAALSKGGEDALAELEARRQDIRKAQTDLTTKGLKGFAPELDKALTKFTKLEAKLRNMETGTKEWKRQQTLVNKAMLEAEALFTDDLASKGIARSTGLNDVAARELAALPKLERLFIGAFDDMGRRFQATLQFAISGAIIFGIQQGLRRFAETAIAVERSFADIGTAFEFDIEATRGTSEFERQLQQVRFQVLGLADEFNVLPTEANKAAFSMISRFGDAQKALVALRAQLLATRISTIDQAEALRALSSVAENFAAASLFVADGASTAEKLQQRQTAAVQNYGRALDVAAALQQQFGVDVEDTLEGVSRLAPTFAKMGFSLEQTASIVASVSRELGLAGSSVADSINRSLGQLVEPGTRDALLNLAAANENLTLTFADFENGERALAALVEQFRHLEQVDPGAAFEVMNILGQRRELDVVAALFNTTELQEGMTDALTNAAGAAEQRFDVLAQTVSERLKSIAGGFERLAQNFTELGLLTPLSLALTAFDNLLQVANKFLETVAQIITEMGKFGTVLKGALVFTIARSSLTRMAGLIANVAGFGFGALGRVAGARSALPTDALAGVAVGAKTVSETFKTLGASVKNNRLGLFALTGGFVQATGAVLAFARTTILASIENTFRAGLTKLATVFGGKFFDAAVAIENKAISLSGGLAGLATTVAAVGSVVVGAIFALKAYTEALKSSKATVVAIENAQKSARAQVSLERTQNPEDFPTVEAFNARVAEVAAQKVAEIEPTITGFFQNMIKGLAGMTEATKRSREELIALIEANNGKPLGEAPEGVGLLAPSAEAVQGTREEIERLIPGTPEFIERFNEELARKQIAEAIASLVQNAIALGAGERPPGQGGRGGRPGRLPNRPGSEVLEKARQLAENLANFPQDPEGRKEALQNAQVAWEELVAAAAAFEDTSGKGIAALEGTAESIGKQLDRAASAFAVGRISRDDLVRTEIEGEIRLRALAVQAASVGTAEHDEVAAELIRQADEAMLERIGHALEALDVQRGQAGLIQNGVAKLRAQLTIEIAALNLLKASTHNQEEVAKQQIVVAGLQHDLADAIKAQALALAEGRVEAARTSAEWFAAQKELIDELRRQLLQLIELDRILSLFGEGLDPAVIQAAKNAVQGAKTEFDDRVLDEGQRTAIATARLKGAINDKLNGLIGQIKAVQLALAVEVNPLEALELQVQLRELLAQKLQEEIARMSAFVEAQAGVSNEILLLQGQIVVANQEVDAAAQIFGTLSSEFNQARLKVANLKNQLGLALLSLDDLNRRLGSDLSNDFEQAILDLQLLAEKLQAPDLGDLEKAQLLLEKARGEMAAERAFFSTELFNLRFLSETGQIGTGAYLSSLRGLLAQVDTTTQQGKEIFLEIQGLIDGMTSDIGDLAFNIPTAIRLPTLFEVRRALAADQMGVNYMDNRQMDITIDVRDATDVEALVNALATSLGGSVTSVAGRFAPGASALTIGGF